MSAERDRMDSICKQMPKVELHAHLNGCVSEEMLSQLADARNNHVNRPASPSTSTTYPLDLKAEIEGTLELSECFRTFAKIHQAISTPAILQWVTTQVIQDFSSDNVVYLELRTTPKIMHAITSKEAYMRSVLQAIIESKASGLPIIVKLLISIDRKLSAIEGMENVELAIEWSKKYPDIIVGIDFSGHPTKGNFEEFIPALKKAKEHGLKITLHLLEVANIEEAKQMLQLGPERVGHAVKTHPASGGTLELWEMLKRLRIPVEVCLTSNLMTRSVKSLEEHHLQYLDADGVPYVICTDDTGVFRTTLSKEYVHMVHLLNLKDASALRKMCLDTVDHIFGGSDVKSEVRSRINQWWDQRQTAN